MRAGNRRAVCGAVALLAAIGSVHARGADVATGHDAATRVGPPTAYSPPVDRLRFGATNVSDPAFYPIPQEPVTRATYMDYLEQQELFDVARSPKAGLGGPQNFLPVLVKYVETGERHWGEAIILMLQDWHRAMLQEVAQKGWTEQFIEEPCFIPLYRKHLVAGGLIKEDEAWFRDLWLDYCRNVHVWGTAPTEWRGGCHRAVPEALMKGLAAQWYPDIPEAGHWKRYAQSFVLRRARPVTVTGRA